MAGKKTGTKKPLPRSAPAAAAGGRKPSVDARRAHGRARADGAAILPAPVPKLDLPRGYAETLRKMKDRIQQARVRTVLAANAAVIRLYWDLGRMILERQAREGWGAKVIDRLSYDLREAFPESVDFLEDVAREGVSVLVTGITARSAYSARAHEYAQKHGITLLGGTHYSTEKFACIAMVEYFGKAGLDAEFVSDVPVMEDA